MKKLLVATALSMLSLPALAADMAPAYKAPPVAPLAVYNWTGFYIGGHVGGGWADLTATSVAPGTASFPVGTAFTTNNLSGVFGGVQGGFNWQFAGSWVLGAEAQFSWSDLSGTATTVSVPFPTVSSTVTARVKDFTLATARLGYAWNNWLFYAKGGGAWGQGNSNGVVNTAAGLFETTSSNTTRTGWVAGAGLEWGFAPNWSAKLEYDHIDFGSQNITVTGTVNGPATYRSSERIDLVEGGVNYRFNFFGQ